MNDYLILHKTGELQKRAKKAWEMLSACRLCPRKCGVNRLDGEVGVCRTKEKSVVASFGAHFGEERALVGTGGSGTIFFGHCNLLCVFCQNYDISHAPEEEDEVEATPEQLAGVMFDLQNQGCHNINFVTPSHVVPQILQALVLAVEHDLSIPLVYNTSAYDNVDTLRLLDGIVDIYMPDFKFWSTDSSRRYMGAADYPETARHAIKEMHRQVGDLIINKDTGLAEKGLLIRHLVMPGGVFEAADIFRFIGDEISMDSYINIMDQYRPCGKASEFEELKHCLSKQEFTMAKQFATQLGLYRFDKRDNDLLLKKLGL